MLSIRKNLTFADIAPIRAIIKGTGFFDQAPDEIDVAIELVELSINKGNNVDNYMTLIAEENGVILGYVCFARVPCSICTFEMYWLCVDKNTQGKGVGSFIISNVEKIVKELGGNKIILQTAGRDLYIPTQRFYVSYGFTLESRIKDYYAIGDDCLTYSILVNR